jgi:hypothetical protein
VAGFTTGSIGKVPEKKPCEKGRNNNNNNNNNLILNETGPKYFRSFIDGGNVFEYKSSAIRRPSPTPRILGGKKYAPC